MLHLLILLYLYQQGILKNTDIDKNQTKLAFQMLFLFPEAKSKKSTIMDVRQGSKVQDLYLQIFPEH